ncbi:MAG TPA: hypothetical protein V6D19_06190 [Stenomitos sp.]
MSKKNLIAGVALALVVAGTLASTADARKGRKCPPGYEDINDKCVFVGHQ